MARKPQSKPSKRRSTPQRKAQPKTLWTWAAGATQSALTTYMSCPEQFALKYVEGVTSNHLTTPLEFGSMFHLCSEHQETASPEVVAAKATAAYIALRKKTIANDEYQDLLKLGGLVEVVFPQYVKYHKDHEKKINWVQRELLFDAPYTFKDDSGRDVVIQLRGKIDGVYRRKDGSLGIREIKTKSKIVGHEIAAGLKSDFQTLFYAVALWLVFGEYPAEVLYDVVKRPGQRDRKTPETQQQFLARVAADIRKKPRDYFGRWQVVVGATVLENFRRACLDPILRDLLRWWGSVEGSPFDRFSSPYHQVRLPSLVTKYGKADMHELITTGRTASYHRREELFPELSELIEVEF